MSITDVSTSNFMGLSATGNGTMEIDGSGTLGMSMSQTNNSHDSEGRISPPVGGVNVMSSLSFEAGPNVNQAVAMRELREESHKKTNGSGSSSGSSPTGSMDLESLKHRYRAALGRKRDLKRLLKRFDEEFQAN